MIPRLLMVVGLLVLMNAIVHAHESVEQMVPSELQVALVAEDWGKAAELVGEVTSETPVPLRFIKGHAGLALNRNNDSLYLFLLSEKVEDLDIWEKWSSAFRRAHPDSAIGHYLYGDSLARKEKYQEAVKVFDQGLTLKPKHSLLLNGLGTAFTRIDRESEARAYFKEAIHASEERLADAYANLGAAWIQSQEGAEGAEKAFIQALQISPGFSLAAHGLMCARVALGKTEELDQLVEISMEVPAVNALIGKNIRDITEKTATGKHITIALNKEAGTSLRKRFDGGPGDELRNKLQSSFNTQKRVNQLNLPQFVKGIYGKYQENLRGRIVADYASRYGKNSTAHAIDKMEINQQQSLQADLGKFAGRASRISNYTKQVGTINSIVVGGGAGKAIGSKTFGAFAAAETKIFFNDISQKNIAQGSMALDVGKAMKAQFGPGHEPPAIPMPKQYSGTRIIPGQKPNSSPGYFGSNNYPGGKPFQDSYAGGAIVSLAEVKWDDGNWPFKPLFGLAYGVVQEKEREE